MIAYSTYHLPHDSQFKNKFFLTNYNFSPIIRKQRKLNINFIIHIYISAWHNLMGSVCGHEKSPKMKLIPPQSKADVPETQATHALPQTQVTFGSQHEDLSATLRSIPYKIPISKSDIRKFYKFQKTLGILFFRTPRNVFTLVWLIFAPEAVLRIFPFPFHFFPLFTPKIKN